MKIENQVCTLEQAKRLKELGIAQQSYFYYYECIVNGITSMPIVNYLDFDYGEYVENESINNAMYGFSKNELYPAFTVAELGVMLPHPSSLSEMGFWLHDSQHDSSSTDKKPWYCCLETPNEKYGGTYRHIEDGETEAQARASMLIHLLENNYITAAEVNQRLQSA